MNYQNKLNAAIQFGLLVDSIEEDEQLHRVPTQMKPKSKNGWYVSYGDLLVMGDWVTGLSRIFKPDGYQRSFIDTKRIKEALEHSKQKRLKVQKLTAISARDQYQQAQQVAVHPYLSAKGLETVDGLKLAGKWLLVPLYDVASNQLVNLQRIAPDGTKLFLKGGQVTGTGCPIQLMDEPISRVYICEGYATAASIRHAANLPVIAAMNAGNLMPVAKAAKQRWPEAEIVIAGDDDWLTEQNTGINPGKSKALEAAYAINAKVCFPPFTLEDKKAGLTDWNDYYRATSNREAA